MSASMKNQAAATTLKDALELDAVEKAAEAGPDTVKVMEDGKLICLNLESNTVVKYKSFDELPDEFANKYAMFKVLKEQEAYEHIGVSLGVKFYYVVK
jgi:tRNA splicing endonuclease